MDLHWGQGKTQAAASRTALRWPSPGSWKIIGWYWVFVTKMWIWRKTQPEPTQTRGLKGYNMLKLILPNQNADLFDVFEASLSQAWDLKSGTEAAADVIHSRHPEEVDGASGQHGLQPSGQHCGSENRPIGPLVHGPSWSIICLWTLPCWGFVDGQIQ